MKNKNINELIPELKEWNNGKGIDITTWISIVGSIEQAIGYSKIFWPKFIEYKNCIFRAERFTEKSVDKWIAAQNGDLASVEAVINHLHLIDLFSNCEPTGEQLVYLGNLLKEMWDTKLSKDFPNRKISVEFNGQEEILDLNEYQITFYQDRENVK